MENEDARRGFRDSRFAFCILHFALCILLVLHRPAQAGSTKIALIGIDGADWKVLDPLIQTGRLPAFASLLESGARGRMIASLPLLSPLIWTTMATGRTADEHGVLDFVGFDENGQRRPVSSYDRTCRALWNIYSDRGRSVGVYGYWATWPAEEVRGEIASNILFENLPLLHEMAPPNLGLLAHPAQLAKQVAFRPIDIDEVSRMSGMTADECRRALAASPAASTGIAQLARVLQTTHALFDLSIARLRAGQPDLFMVYFEGPDIVSHVFHSEKGREVIARYYELIDTQIAAYRRALSPDTLLIVCSDHGFLLAGEQGGEGDPADFYAGAASYHRRYGIFLATGPGVMHASADVSPLDIAPTLLAASGLPVASDLPGRIAPIFGEAPQVSRVPTFETTPLARIKPAGPSGDSIENLRALGYILSPSPTFAVNLGRVLLEKGDLTGAEKAITEAVELDPRRPSTLYDLLDLRRQQGDHAGIISAARRFARLPGPPRPDVVIAAVHSAIETQGPDAASAILDEIGGEGPSPLRSLARAVIIGAQGKPAEAIQAMRAACEADPSLTRSAVPELVEAAIASNPQRGLEALDKLTAADSSVLVTTCRARLLAAAGRPREALPLFEAALDEIPDSVDLMIEAAQARFATGDLAGARLLFERAIARDPRSNAALLGAGAAAAATGDDRAAIGYIEIADFSASPEALNALALSYNRIGNRVRARQLLRASLELKNDQPGIREMLRKMEAE